MFGEVATVIVVLGLIFFVGLIFWKRPVSVARMTLKSPQNLDPSLKVVVVWGASGNVGFKIIENLIESGKFAVIGVSRTYENWYCKVKDQEHIRDKVQWIGCDIRLQRDVKRVIEKIKSVYGRIDAFINACVIGRPGGLPNQYTTARDRSDVLIRLPNAFPPKDRRENCDMFFTNFIGLSNLLREESRSGAKVIINPVEVDDFTDLLLKKWCECDAANHVRLIQMDLRKNSADISAKITSD